MVFYYCVWIATDHYQCELFSCPHSPYLIIVFAVYKNHDFDFFERIAIAYYSFTLSNQICMQNLTIFLFLCMNYHLSLPIRCRFGSPQKGEISHSK